MFSNCARNFISERDALRGFDARRGRDVFRDETFGNGLARGTAMPLLLDLAAKPNFLHNDSVPSLDALLDPSRGPQALHPFYISDPQERAAMVTFLKSLDIESR